MVFGFSFKIGPALFVESWTSTQMLIGFVQWLNSAGTAFRHLCLDFHHLKLSFHHLAMTFCHYFGEIIQVRF